MSMKTKSYWKVDHVFGRTEKKVDSLLDIREDVRSYFMQAAAERARWKASEGRWHEVIRFALVCEEFFARFDEDFERQAKGNIFHMEIPDGLMEIRASALAYGGY